MKVNKQELFEKLDNNDIGFVSAFKTKDLIDWNKYKDVITSEKIGNTWDKFVNKV